MKLRTPSPELQTFFVPGFKAAGIACGIKPVPRIKCGAGSAGSKQGKDGKKDLAIIYSEVPAVAAGVFTTNKIKAAPVLIDMQRIKKGLCQAIIINSGNANACTGKQGLKDAQAMLDLTEKTIGIKKGLAFVSSTGVIGQPLPIDKIKKGILTLNSKLQIPNPSPLSSPQRGEGRVRGNGWHDAVEAIMTTDAFPKIATTKGKIGSKEVTVLGIAKGAGMICPNMATMLSFIATDVNIEKNALQKALKKAVDNSFNSITVDGDTSTNDTVLALANGKAGNKKCGVRSAECGVFYKLLEKVCKKLAFMIVMDGEGATKLLEFKVIGAKNSKDAKKIAETAANSLLVKTAFFGEDANWGRLMAAIGRAGVDVKEEKINIHFNDVPVVLKGRGTNKEKAASNAVKQKHICIRIELGLGKSTSTVWASDLSYEYVKINASYRT